MVRNIHERQLAAPPAAVGALIDSLATPDDRLWPRGQWPAMRFDRPLGVGARGGHGPIGYTVVAYEPGRRVRFEFRAPAGFHGYHEYEVLPGADQGCLLRHSLVMTTGWPAWVSWPAVYRPLHDALIEDSLDTAAHHLGLAAVPSHRWSRWVRALRSLIRRRRP
ncbi:SRPBCC family protein [Micromonospora okii]|uniref:SRPBCC family protein n=1 Tax=Micromonospora okii TaxID=1182970 RepID=UPI001E379251|nr:SRPBCC family protein [Micromonospora okii]